MKIKYPFEWSERDHFERPAKGWLSDVTLELDNGNVHIVTIYDPVRLAQDLEEELGSGGVGIIEKGLLVVSEVSKENIEKAIFRAVETGVFK